MGNVSSGHQQHSRMLTVWSEPRVSLGGPSPGPALWCCADCGQMTGYLPFDSQRRWTAWTWCWLCCARCVCQRRNTSWPPSSPPPRWRSSSSCHSLAVVRKAGGPAEVAGRLDAGCHCRHCSCHCQRLGCQSCCWWRQWCGCQCYCCCCWRLLGCGSSQTPARRWQGWLQKEKTAIHVMSCHVMSCNVT